MILTVSLALAAARCPATLDLAVGDSLMCAGTPSAINPEGIAGALPHGGEFAVQGLAEGTAVVYLADGSLMTVRVSSCSGRIARYKAVVPERDGVHYACDDGYVVISTDRPIHGKTLEAVRAWEDAEKTIFVPPGGMPRLTLQVTALHLSREMVTQVGLDLSSPVRLFKKMADVFTQGLGNLSDSMLYGPGFTDMGSSWSHVVEQDVFPFEPFSVCAGPETNANVSGAQTSQMAPIAGGLCVSIDHVHFLSDGHQIRGRLTVRDSSAESSTVSRGVFVQTQDVLKSETPLRLSLNQSHVVAASTPSGGTHYNHSLPLLGEVPILEDILGSTEQRDSESETLIYMTLRAARSPRDEQRRIEQAIARGQSWSHGGADE